jgi:hypothetical protein
MTLRDLQKESLDMSKGSIARVASGATAAVIAVGTSFGLGATAASAASTVHTVKYSCKIPVVGTQLVSARVSLSAPPKTTTGKTVKVSVQLQPTGLPAVAVTNLTVKATLNESGAQKGSVTISEFLKKANSGNLRLNLSGRLTLTKAGTVHLKPGSVVTFSLTSSLIGKATLTCTAKSSLPVIGSIVVAKAKHTAVARTNA